MEQEPTGAAHPVLRDPVMAAGLERSCEESEHSGTAIHSRWEEPLPSVQFSNCFLTEPGAIRCSAVTLPWLRESNARAGAEADLSNHEL